jgi:hypothetical protein
MRIPEELKNSLDAAAAAANRSLTAEVVSRLQASFTSQTESANPSGMHMLQQLADERKSTAEALGSLCTTLAKMLLAAVRLFTPEQKKKAPEIGVWGAIAEGVVKGKSAAIVEMFEKMKSSDFHGPLDGPAK